MRKDMDELTAIFKAVTMLAVDSGLWTNEVYSVVNALITGIDGMQLTLPDPALFTVSTPVQIISHSEHHSRLLKESTDDGVTKHNGR